MPCRMAHMQSADSSYFKAFLQECEDKPKITSFSPNDIDKDPAIVSSPVNCSLLSKWYAAGDGRMPNVQDIMGADNQCAGMSPRSAASDDIAGGSPGNSDDEAGENLNDRNEPQPSTLSDSMHTVSPGQLTILQQNFAKSAQLNFAGR